MDDPSGSHVLASVVGVPGSSGVDCGFVAEVVERHHDAPKRLLQFAGSQATTVPAGRATTFRGAGLHPCKSKCTRGGSFFSTCGCIISLVDDVSTEHVEDDAQSVRVGSEVGERMRDSRPRCLQRTISEGHEPWTKRIVGCPRGSCSKRTWRNVG